MSKSARMTIGFAALFSSIAFFLLGGLLGPQLPAGSWPFFGLSAVCAIVVVACFLERARSAAVRIIGAVVFAAYVAYLISAWNGARWAEAAVGFFVWGLPAGYVAVAGVYPSWGHGAAAFRSGTRDETAAEDYEDWPEGEEAAAIEAMDNGEQMRLDSRKYGLGMIVAGAVVATLPFVGLGLRGQQAMGTWITAAAVFAIGCVAVVASLNKNLTSAVELITRAALYLVVLAMLLILLAIPFGIVFFLWTNRA